MKRTIKFLWLMVLVALIGCGNQNENQDISNEQSADAKKPTIDLFAAAATGNVEEINLHIKAGSDLNVKEPGRGSSPLLTAIVFDKFNAVEALIKGGADINQQNNENFVILNKLLLILNCAFVFTLSVSKKVNYY